MRDGWKTLGALALGAGLVYFLDPQSGERRRALVRDRSARAIGRVRSMTGRAGTDLGNRIQGRLMELQTGREAGNPGARRLTERVRARLGRVRALNVEAVPGGLLSRGVLPMPAGRWLGRGRSGNGAAHGEGEDLSRWENDGGMARA